MTQIIQEPVSVILASDSQIKKTRPSYLFWKSKKYSITKVAFHHTYRRGQTLFHVYSVLSSQLYFKLVFNTDSLSWQLEEFSDVSLS